MPRALLVTLLVLVAPLTPIRAQAPVDPPNLRNTATVPESNEAMLLASQVEQAAANGEFRLALGLIEKLFTMQDELVMTPGGRTLYPVWDQARRMYGQLPPAAVALYRQLNDAEVAARFESARGTGTLDELETLFRHCRASTSWPAIGQELAVQEVERGRFTDAIDVIRTLEEAGGDVSGNVQLLLAVALERGGAHAAAERALQKIDALHAPPDVKERTTRIRRWFEQQSTGNSNGPPAAALVSAIATQAPNAIWSSELETPEAGARDDEQKMADAIEAQGRLPLYGLAQTNDTVIVRLRGTLWAFDALTLALRWTASENIGPEEQAGGRDESGARPVSREAKLMLRHALRHAISAGCGMVYTIEGTRGDDGPEPERMWGVRLATAVFANELVGRDLRNGEILWRSSATNDSFRNAAFQDAPLIVDGTLCAPVQRGENLFLCRIDPRTGKLLKEIPLIGPPTSFPYNGGRCRLAADETTIYVSTGNGVIAAVRRDDLHWKWASLYASTISRATIAPWMNQRPAPQREYDPEPIVLADELVLVAPPDSDGILALDRFSGRQVWPALERQNYEHLVGMLPDGVVTGSNQLACVDVRDGKTLRWRSVPLQLTGRPVIVANLVFAPTSDGIVVIDGRTGKLLRDAKRSSIAQAALNNPQEPGGDEDSPAAATEILTANLFVLSDGLLAVTPSRLIKLAVPERTQQLAEAAAATDAATGAIGRAWAALLQGQAESSLQILESLEAGNEAISRARDEVMTHALVALSTGAADDPARIEWLRRAASLSSSPRMRVRVNILMGQALERNQRWPEAFAHYAAMLGDDAAQALLESGDNGTRIAGWLHALRRMQIVAPRLGSTELLTQARAFVQGANLTALERLLHVLPDNRAFQQLLRVRLATLPAPYELLATALPEDDPALPPLERRRLFLERWMTHVALGQLGAARADREEWDSTYSKLQTNAGGAAESGAASEAPATQNELLKRIRDLMAKMEREDRVPLDSKPAWSWHSFHSELILDPENATSAQQSFILARKSDKEGLRIYLLSALKGGWVRQTADSVSGAVTSARQIPRDIVVVDDQHSERPRRANASAAVWQYLAAIPVEGGLIALGLGPNGPDRRAGTRLWEHAIPEWSRAEGPPRENLCAGPLGVYVLRPDGVLMLLGWADGSVWWECNIKGFELEHMDIVQNRLVVIGHDARVLILDALRGKFLSELPGAFGSARGAMAVRDRIVLWNEDTAAGFDAHSPTPAWTTRISGGDKAAALPQIGAVGVRSARSLAWTILDVETGKAIISDGLEGAGSILSAVRRDDALIVCDQTADGATVRFSSFGPDGQLRWQTPVPTTIPPNHSQMTASAKYIPLLSLTPATGEEQGAELWLQMVDKSTGTLAALPLTTFFKESEVQAGEPLLLATPERLIVQWKGTLVGLGSEGTHQ